MQFPTCSGRGPRPYVIESVRLESQTYDDATLFLGVLNMKRFTLLLTIAALSFSPAALFAKELKAGDAAPDFSLKGSDGKTYTLADFKGKQAVVVAWFPKAFTGG